MKNVSSITVEGSKGSLSFFTRLKIDRKKRISVSAKSPSISVLRIWNLESGICESGKCLQTKKHTKHCVGNCRYGQFLLNEQYGIYKSYRKKICEIPSLPFSIIG